MVFTWAHGHMGAWTHGHMGMWPDGHMGMWAYGYVGIWLCGILDLGVPREFSSYGILYKAPFVKKETMQL